MATAGVASRLIRKPLALSARSLILGAYFAELGRLPGEKRCAFVLAQTCCKPRAMQFLAGYFYRCGRRKHQENGTIGKLFLPIQPTWSEPMPILNLSAEDDIHYELIEGDPAKPCLVFLHEGLGCCAMWKDFPAQLCLATGCRGLLYDRLGYGLSSPLRGRRQLHYLHDYALRELPQVLEKLIPGQDHFVIGHSDGGSIALIYAAQQAPRLRGIITEAAHVFVEGMTLDGIRKAELAFGAGKLDALVQYHGDKTQAIFKAWCDTWLSYGFRFWNIEYLLPSIECPALVVQGSEDQYGSAEQVETIVGLALNAVPAMVEQCGHTPHQEQPQALLALMAGFLLGRMDAAPHLSPSPPPS
ncbi:MAG: hypothetical protein RLZZ237_1832 [Pseudomonadota bacterium]|jgi:pimeloyl-ACP methyl ester carboxylesterase